jgi:hypothetical protein
MCIAVVISTAIFSAVCRFYFAYCEAAFDERYIHTFQVLWVKGAEPRNSMAAPAGATLAEAVAEPSRRPSSPDPMTQVLLVVCISTLHNEPSACGAEAAKCCRSASRPVPVPALRAAAVRIAVLGPVPLDAGRPHGVI